MKSILFFIVMVLLFASCQAKPEQQEDALSSSAITSVNNKADNQALPNKSSIKKVVSAQIEKSKQDSVSTTSNDLDCYVWANTYLATTAVEDQEGDQFELYISITLKDYEKNDYVGTINMWLSGCEEQMFQGTVKASAQQNYVTVYFDENISGMEDMFKKDDKLVKFEISYGEYVASWFQAMNDYVDEYTVLSLQK